MKLKNKFICLGIAALLCGSFCANGVVVEAEKSSTVVKTGKNQVKDSYSKEHKKSKRGKRRKVKKQKKAKDNVFEKSEQEKQVLNVETPSQQVDFASSVGSVASNVSSASAGSGLTPSGEARLQEFKSFYEGSNFSESNPVFIFGVNPGEDDKLKCFPDGMLYFSPTMANKLSGRNFQFDKFIVELVDDKKRSFKLTEGHLNSGLAGNMDMIWTYVPDVQEIVDNKSIYRSKYGITVDEGFEIAVGKPYKIRLLDMDGRVLVERDCISVDNTGLKRVDIVNSIAHPESFDLAYYSEQVRKFEEGKRNREKASSVGYVASNVSSASAGSGLTPSGEAKLQEIKSFYEGSDFSPNGPVFGVGVNLTNGRVRNFADMFIYFSPTMVRELSGRDFQFDKYTVEVVDDKKRVFKRTEDHSKKGLAGGIDVISVYVPDVQEVLDNRSDYARYSGITVDDGFEIDAGKPYKVRVLDSYGNVLVEEVCTSVDISEFKGRDFVNSIAHPKSFDLAYYSEQVRKFEEGKRNREKAGSVGYVASNVSSASAGSGQLCCAAETCGGAVASSVADAKPSGLSAD